VVSRPPQDSATADGVARARTRDKSASTSGILVVTSSSRPRKHGALLSNPRAGEEVGTYRGYRTGAASTAIRSRIGSRLHLGSAPTYPNLDRRSPPPARRGESYLDGRERSSSLWRRIRAHAAISLIVPENGETSRLMVWTPARSASQWAQDVLSNIRTKQGRVRKWKLHNDRDRLGEECARCERCGWQRASGDAPATEVCAGGRQCVGCRAAMVRIEAPKNLSKAAPQNLRRVRIAAN
jgi:hypothetical protein